MDRAAVYAMFAEAAKVPELRDVMIEELRAMGWTIKEPNRD